MLEKQNKPYFQNSLPYCQIQTAQLGGFYYKTADKIHHCNKMLKLKIGLKVGEFGRAQEDHVSYLVQIVNSKASNYRLVILGHHFIFLQRVGCIFQVEEQQKEWFIIKQRQLFQKLSKNVKVFTKLLNQQLSNTSLLSTQFSEVKLKQKINEIIQGMEKKGS